MIVLGIDTSTILGGVALVHDGRLMAETRVDARAAASERIMLQIDRLLGDLGWRAADISRVGVAIGPGSFTGLRVGLGTAKGLALGLSVPLAPVASIAARIHALGLAELPVLLATAEHRGEVFAAAGAWTNGEYREIVPESSRPLGEAPAWVEEAIAAANAGRLFLAGDAADKVLAALPPGGETAARITMLRCQCGAAPGSVALIAAHLAPEALLHGAAIDDLVPRYLRGTDARRPGRPGPLPHDDRRSVRGPS